MAQSAFGFFSGDDLRISSIDAGAVDCVCFGETSINAPESGVGDDLANAAAGSAGEVSLVVFSRSAADKSRREQPAVASTRAAATSVSTRSVGKRGIRILSTSLMECR